MNMFTTIDDVKIKSSPVLPKSTYRTRYDLFASVLNEMSKTDKPITKERIKLLAQTTNKTMVDIINVLTSKEFIREFPPDITIANGERSLTYKITNKGRQYLLIYNQLMELFNHHYH